MFARSVFCQLSIMAYMQATVPRRNARTSRQDPRPHACVPQASLRILVMNIMYVCMLLIYLCLISISINQSRRKRR